jgi:hypothetical protein
MAGGMEREAGERTMSNMDGNREAEGETDGMVKA